MTKFNIKNKFIKTILATTLLFSCVVALLLCGGCSGNESIDEPITVSLTVDCSRVFDSPDKVASGKEYLLDTLPQDGFIANSEKVACDNGDSIVTVLQSYLKAKGYQYDISFGYVKGICNLYEFDFGGSSGWMVKVNGSYIGVSASNYKLSDSDSVYFVYVTGYTETA